jgi:hypothetical protein
MAMELRDQARKLPSMLTFQGIKLLGSETDTASEVYKLLNPDKDSPAAKAVTALTPSLIKAFLKKYFPEDKSTDLKAVIRTYDLFQNKITPGQKKPIIIIGAFQ